LNALQFDDVVTRLEAALSGPLPGLAAQGLLAPQPRRRWPDGFNPARVRNAAGLLLVFPIEDRAHLILTVRSDTLGRHSGQVSLPGGVVETGESFEQAALREAHEEIALPPGATHVLGPLTPLDIPISGFRLHPVVAAIDYRPRLSPADGEVAAILEVPIDALLDRRNLTSTERERDGQTFRAPAFRIGERELWGATAMVMAEFLTLLGWSPR
jgi:8-oxo-dGTP pyrophosphatase MutT (NUDIX family)